MTPSITLKIDIDGGVNKEHQDSRCSIEKAYALGSEEAKIIDTKTVVVEKWVRWKNLCGLSYVQQKWLPPPYAPSADETKDVLNEYTKAVLLKGPK